MAEAVFRHMTHFSTPRQHDLVSQIDSCAIESCRVGRPTDGRTLDVLAKHGIQGYSHKARQIRMKEDFSAFDLVIIMQESQRTELVEQAENCGCNAQKCRLFSEFGAEDEDEIKDPFYAGKPGITITFEETFKQVQRCADGLLGHIDAGTWEKVNGAAICNSIA